jgi:hypothetical protein
MTSQPAAASRESWDRLATDYAPGGHRAWAGDDITWGIWHIRQVDLHLRNAAPEPATTS